MSESGALPADLPDTTRAALDAAPAAHRDGLVALRELILEVADDVGSAPVQEGLAWGQPSFRSARPHESTPVRIASSADGSRFGLFCHCRSTVVREFREQFPNDFVFDGDRGILFRPGDDLQPERLRLAVEHALRYRMRPVR